MEPEASGTDQRVGEIDTALCRATLYGALALGFRRPTEEAIARLVSKEGKEALADAAAILDSHPHPYPLPFRARETTSTLSFEERDRVRRDFGLAATVKSLDGAQAASVIELSASYRRLFGHTAGGAVPPYETEYGSEALFQQPQELGDLMGFYSAFGLTLNAAEHERADHISCECEFLSFLALKEAYALEKRDDSMLEETRKAARLFLRDHLGRFVPAFAKRLTREDRDGFYGALGELCLRLVTLECARSDLPLGSVGLDLRPATDDRVPMACGNGAECAAMPGAGTPEEIEE
jgi:DMSO reductase family type II enzyme chaperone